MSRARTGRGDRGSMPMAMLLTVVGVALCALLASIVTGSIRDTRSDVQRAQALSAAQAGLDVALARIMSARDAGGLLVLDGLPRTALAGAPGTPQDGAYSATVRYYDADPRGRDAAWLAANGTVAAQAGTRYALVTSIGTDGRGGTPRTLVATYAFTASGAGGAPGGPIRLWAGPGDPDLCVAGAHAIPAAGNAVLAAACVAGAAAQTFVYGADLTIATAAGGLCLDPGSGAVGTAVTLAACETPVPARQRWRYTAVGNFDTDGGGGCLNNVGGVLRIGGTCGNEPDRVQTWRPAADVGTGAAGPAGQQLVNAGDYARCLDVIPTETAPSWPYVKVYPCSQHTDPAAVPWQERWTWPAAGAGPIWFTHPTRGTFCLTAPAVGASPALVTAEACVPTALQPAARRWTVTGEAGTWEQSFRIVSGTGQCLSSSTLPVTWYANKAVVAPCDGGPIQKWNAAPGAFEPRLRDLGER